ncbi:MAG: hypothetical protein PUB51_02515 [Oscillospiraceae bacterium]|nr:hypothetical protein [Oscillospiraceae bacterium]
MYKRIITCFLSLAIVFTLCSPLVAFASSGGVSSSNKYSSPTGGSLLLDTASVVAWQEWFNINKTPILSDLGSAFTGNALFSCFDAAMRRSGVGLCKTTDVLHSCAFNWNLGFYEDLISNHLLSISSSFKSTYFKPVVDFDAQLDVIRLKDSYSGLWLVNSSGHFPYYRPSDSGSGTTPAIERVGKWNLAANYTTSTELWHVVSNYELNEYREMWLDVYPACRIAETSNFYWLTVNSGGRALVLCDKYGYPYYLPKDKKTAVTTPQNYYQDTTNQYVDNTTNNFYDYETNEYNQYDNSTNVNVYDGGAALVGSPIDVNNGIINVGGELQYIDNLTYDASTQTYYVDAHDEYTYDTTNNYYTTNNYSYFVQYHIDYTSITYIGQTAEYDKRYELYYQLPDGRSSADLTAEDLEQLSTVFADVVPYTRSADNADLRFLYHFDGNTEDSSYWSYCTSFDWASGASLTYMDEGTFNGALYLDETEHEFTISLPGNDLGSDFTFQFRYYQSHTVSAQLDSYIKFGDETLFQLDGAKYYNGSGMAICSTSIGNWNEICLMKKDSVLYYFINGVAYGSVSDNVYHSPTITFHFGSSQQTYCKLDEMRLTKAAIYTPGVNYTPSAVPYDTNLSLVLPDSRVPLADEVMVLHRSENNMLTPLGLDDWTVPNAVSSLSAFNLNSNNASSYSPGFGLYPISSVPSFNSVSTSFPACNFGRIEFCKFSVPLASYWLEGNISLFLPTSTKDFFDASKTYCFSVLLSDGSFSYCTFTPVDGKSVSLLSTVNSSVISFKSSNVSKCVFSANPITGQSGTSSSPLLFGISVCSSADCDVVYMEIVEGDKPDFSVTYESAFYDPEEMKESPVLAVRTNRPITGYQIGGVRPSYPEKGLVYAMVENSRILSLQQYTGYAWEEVDGRIWTGERWIPYSSFDVFTLQDFYDIIGGSGEDYEYIYTESGFWSWLQKAWGNMMAKLDSIIAALGGDSPGSGSGSGADDSTSSLWQTLLDFLSSILGKVLSLVSDLLGFFFDFLSDTVVSGVRSFFDSVMSVSIIEFFQREEPILDENGEPVLDENGEPKTIIATALPSGVAAIFAFFSGLFLILPAEIRFVFVFGLVVTLFFAVVNKLLGS